MMISLRNSLFLPLIVVFGFTAGCSKTPAPESPAIQSVHFTLIAESHSTSQSQRTVSKIWQMGDKVRIERDDGTVVIVAPPYEYKYTKGASEGVRMRIDRPSRKARTPIEEALLHVKEITSAGKSVGRETVEGVDCEKYEAEKLGRDVLGGRWKATLWYSPATGFPVKVVQDISGGGSTVIYRDVEINLQLPDNLFLPPTGIQFDHLEIP